MIKKIFVIYMLLTSICLIVILKINSEKVYSEYVIDSVKKEIEQVLEYVEEMEQALKQKDEELYELQELLRYMNDDQHNENFNNIV